MEGMQRMREDTGAEVASVTAEPAGGSGAVLWKSTAKTTSAVALLSRMLDRRLCLYCMRVEGLGVSKTMHGGLRLSEQEVVI